MLTGVHLIGWLIFSGGVILLGIAGVVWLIRDEIRANREHWEEFGDNDRWS